MQTLTLQPDESDPYSRDTFIADAVFTNINYGGSPSMTIGTQPVTKAQQGRFRAVLRFNVAALLGATITDATLTLTTGTGNLSNETFAVHRLTQPNWSEFGATWNLRDGVSSWATPGGDFDPTPAQSIVLPSVQNLVFDQLKPLIVDAIQNRGGLLDVLIKGSSTTGLQIANCFSSGSETASNRPKLVVNYDFPPWCVEVADRAVWSVDTQDRGC